MIFIFTASPDRKEMKRINKLFLDLFSSLSFGSDFLEDLVCPLGGGSEFLFLHPQHLRELSHRLLRLHQLTQTCRKQIGGYLMTTPSTISRGSWEMSARDSPVFMRSASVPT